MGALKFSRSRCALSISLAAALLAACGGSSVPVGGMNDANGPANSSSGKKTFRYTGKKQSFVVPVGVTQLAVDVRGAGGADAGYKGSPSFLPPAAGGIVEATIPVQPAEKFYVYVGGRGVGGSGGFNGGASGDGYGGGGASDIRTGGDTLQDRIIVAAGGGGSGGPIYFYYSYGGIGGGLKGSPGSGGGSRCSGGGGRGGTQLRGGSGGRAGKGPSSGEDGQAGTDGSFGNGGKGGAKGLYGRGGGGGGGGYYGGGGGGSGASGYSSGCGGYASLIGGGGGGGSSYIEPSATNGRMLTGEASARGDGRVVIRWN